MPSPQACGRRRNQQRQLLHDVLECRCLQAGSRIGVQLRPASAEVQSVSVLASQRVIVERDLPFESDNGRVLALDVYRPAGTAPDGGWPVVVAIHGGGWHRFSKNQYGPKAARLTRGGFAVVAPNYTLTRPAQGSWPDNLNDLKGALRWVAGNADRYAFDVERVATLGESAGGHLALMLAIASTQDASETGEITVGAVVDFYGPTDLWSLASSNRAAASAIYPMFGGRRERQLFDDASPLRRFDDKTPPVLVIHGQRDQLVPLSQSRALAAALRARNIPHQLVVIAGAPHGFGWNVGRRDLLDTTLDFLDTHLKPAHSR